MKKQHFCWLETTIFLFAKAHSPYHILHTEAKPCFANTCEESCELFKRKPNKQYHTDNQGKEDNIVEITSILQPQKIPEGVRIRVENHFPQLETKNPSFSTETLSENEKNENFFSKFFEKNSEGLRQVT